jgi:Holliday junction resolvasome RuvABC endonuclease subunit
MATLNSQERIRRAVAILLSYFIVMKKCKLLSLDSSTKSTGFAIFVNGNYKESCFIDHSKIKDAQERLSAMISDIYKIIDKYSPDIVTWEITVVVRNPQVQRDLTMIVGAIMGKCIEKNIFFYPFRPTEWRKLVSDGEKLPKKRDELKQWGKDKVKELFNIDVENDDVSDAILIGQAYIDKFRE